MGDEMGRKRGFFAELQHQKQMEARRAEQAARAAHRQSVAAHREAERAQKAAERAATQRARATAAEQKAADREAKRLHDEARSAEAAAKNAELAEAYDQIDSLLAATLERDDYVDLNSLRTVAEHPPFPDAQLEVPTPPVTLTPAPPEPVYVEPELPKGLGAVFGGKKKHAELVAQGRAQHEADHAAWKEEIEALPDIHAREKNEHEKKEQERANALAEAKQRYQNECDVRDAAAADSNRQLDELIAGIDYNVEDAIQQYVGIVLGNSVYPESFPVDHDFEYDSAQRELSLSVTVPGPSELPTEKEFRYVKAKDEISATALPKKDQKERYNNAVFQVALRSLHEIFEADRAARIQTIALKVGAPVVDPATGINKNALFVAAAAERDTFLTFQLANVDPKATLEHLGASVSKNPFELVEADSQGVRRS